MGPPCAAVEPPADPRPIESVLEQAKILGGRPQKHRHLVETNARASLREDSSRDFYALAPFAGGGEHAHIAHRTPLRRLPRGEQRAAKRRQIRITGGLG